MKILQVVGYKNAGKTTLVRELVRSLTAQGLRIGTLKHDGHDFEPDVPGTDTWQHREAGAEVTAISSAHRTAWFMERSTPMEELVRQMAGLSLHGVIAEGFKTAPYPKIVLLRDKSDSDLFELTNIIAAAVRETGDAIESQAAAYGCPLFRTNPEERTALLKFIANWFYDSH